MKIGILTYHRAENYGALLQAYALMTYLRSLGHDVSFVDYWPKYHSDYFKIFSWKVFKRRSLKGKILMFSNLILPTKHIRKHRLQRFIHEKLGLSKNPRYTDENDTTEKYDVVFYGSDQIWRKQNLDGVGFDKWYFGAHNVVASKKIVYAGSMGTINTTVDDDDFVKGMMSNFEIISVRENDLKSYLQRLGVESLQVIDPVFLLTKEQWRRIKTPSILNNKYILFYNLLNSAKARNFADRLGKEKGMPVIEINKKTMMGKGYVRNASVEMFLQLIDDADYVVSNSFHGVAFSVIFEKQFYAVGMGEKSSRVVSLLSALDISNRYIEDGLSFSQTDINYERVKNSLKQFKEFSVAYIKNAIVQ